jgi:glycosyltransferase involved in cell wall biosynthesis
MKFSIIIPTYNRRDTISKAIDSCLMQTYRNYEIIVIDDGSTDNTQDVLKPYISSKQISYVYTHNIERGAARNIGIKKSSGDYVTFLDSDDIYYKNYLQCAYEYIDKEKCQFFHQAFDLVDENFKLIRKLKEPKSDAIVYGNFLACMGVFVKREVMVDYQFVEDRILAGSEDYELWLRLYANFGLHTSPVVGSAMVQHTQRSELNIDKAKLARRIALLVRTIQEQQLFDRSTTKKIISNIYMYTAINLLEAGDTKNSIKNFLNAIKENFTILHSRKSIALIYHIITG